MNDKCTFPYYNSFAGKVNMLPSYRRQMERDALDSYLFIELRYF